MDSGELVGNSWNPTHPNLTIKMEGSGEGLTQYVIVLSPNIISTDYDDIRFPEPKLIGTMTGTLVTIEKARFSKELI